ncbi:MAG: hypothetical protein R3E12_10865 [Candidatus Eisenbacteria bacterium]
MIGIAGRGLDLPPHQQRILMGDEELSVVRNRRPARPLHEHVVQRGS